MSRVVVSEGSVGAGFAGAAVAEERGRKLARFYKVDDLVGLTVAANVASRAEPYPVELPRSKQRANRCQQ